MGQCLANEQQALLERHFSLEPLLPCPYTYEQQLVMQFFAIFLPNGM